MNSTVVRQSAEVLQEDEVQLLKVYRKAKSMGYADISVTVQEGIRVKLWLTEKMR